jgi:hypothetical protein
MSDAPNPRDVHLPLFSDSQLRLAALEKAVDVNSFSDADEIVKAAQKFFDFLTKD